MIIIPRPCPHELPVTGIVRRVVENRHAALAAVEHLMAVYEFGGLRSFVPGGCLPVERAACGPCSKLGFCARFSAAASVVQKVMTIAPTKKTALFNMAISFRCPCEVTRAAPSIPAGSSIRGDKTGHQLYRLFTPLSLRGIADESTFVQGACFSHHSGGTPIRIWLFPPIALLPGHIRI